MTDFIHLLVERYGLLAVFLGCVAEGESAAILGGFLSHQAVFVPWHAFTAAFVGAFTGDTLFFLLGRRYADRPFVVRMRHRPGFAHAYRLVQKHPNLFVLSNRYIYGLRLAGGIAAGFSNIPTARFVVLNAISSFVWAALFSGIGYFFGLGAEHLIGDAILAHERLLIGLALLFGFGVAAWFLAHYVARREKQADAREEDSHS